MRNKPPTCFNDPDGLGKDKIQELTQLFSPLPAVYLKLTCQRSEICDIKKQGIALEAARKPLKLILL